MAVVLVRGWTQVLYTEDLEACSGRCRILRGRGG